MKGPKFAKAKPVTLNIDGNVIKLMAPRHKTKFPNSPIYVKNKKDLKVGFRPPGKDSMANNNWEYCTLLRRSWSYWLSWFGKYQGELSLNIAAWMRAPERSGSTCLCVES